MVSAAINASQGGSQQSKHGNFLYLRPDDDKVQGSEE